MREQLIQQLKAQFARYQRKEISAHALKLFVLKVITADRKIFEEFRKVYASGALDGYLPIELQSRYKGLSDFNQTVQNMVAIKNDPRLIKIANDLNKGRITKKDAEVEYNALRTTIAKEIIADKSNKRGLFGLFEMPFETVQTAFNEFGKTARAVIDTGGKVAEKTIEKTTELAKEVKDDVVGFLNTGTLLVGGVVILGGFLVYKVVTSDTGKTLAANYGPGGLARGLHS